MRYFGTLLFVFALLLSRSATAAESKSDVLTYSPASKFLSVLFDCEENLNEEEGDDFPIAFLAPTFFQPINYRCFSSLELSLGADQNITNQPPLYCLYRVYLI